MVHANFKVLCFTESESLTIKVLIAGMWIFDLFCFGDLNLMTFIYELDPYFLEIYWMCKSELLTLKLSKLII